MTDDYLIEFEEIKKLSIQNFLNRLQKTEGKEIKNLKIKDLSYFNNKLIFPGIGVYIFRENKEVVLVGKVSSMSFTERIAKHFDTRKGAWFNRLLVLLCTKKLNLEGSNENLKVASKYAFDNLNLVLVHYSYEDWDKINNTEKLLRSCTNALNKFKTIKENNLNKLVIEYLTA